MSTLHKINSLSDFVSRATRSIAEFLKQTMAQKYAIRAALSGGQSPIKVYEALARDSSIPWDRVELFLVDERYVPLNSGESNARMIRKTRVGPVGGVKTLHFYDTARPIETLAEEMDQFLKKQSPPLFDLVLLGLGADGHTASLFPGSPALRESQKFVVATQKPGNPPQDRLTLTFPALLSSRKIFFLIRGKEKEAVLERWLQGASPIEALPAAGVLGHPDLEIFYCPS